jgi:hypothetical protein
VAAASPHAVVSALVTVKVVTSVGRMSVGWLGPHKWRQG